MTEQFYGITVSPSSTQSNEYPTKKQLDDILFSVRKRFSLFHIPKHKIHCYELQKPTKKFTKGRLHSHSLLFSTKYSYHKKLIYKDVNIYKDFNVQIKLLLKPMDRMIWAGYVQKNKIDMCDTILKQVQTFRKDIKKGKIKKVRSILDYLKKGTGGDEKT